LCESKPLLTGPWNWLVRSVDRAAIICSKLNLSYAIIGVLLTLAFMAANYKRFDGLTPFDTSHEPASKNAAVGIVAGIIFIGPGIAVGLVIGMGLNGYG